MGVAVVAVCVAAGACLCGGARQGGLRPAACLTLPPPLRPTPPRPALHLHPAQGLAALLQLPEAAAARLVLRAPMLACTRPDTLAAKVAALAGQLGLPRAQVLRWGCCWAVLLACWRAGAL